jgi:hypothetical protein
MALLAPAVRDGLSILTAESDRALFDRILGDSSFAEIEDYPHTGAFGRRYHEAIHGNCDCSFAVHADGVPLLVCMCAPVDDRLSFYGMPVRIIVRQHPDAGARPEAVPFALSYLDQIAGAKGLREVVVLNHRNEDLPGFDEACRSRGAAMQQQPVASVDLAAGPAAWRAALRKSSRSLINWGRRNLSIAQVNKERPDRVLFDRYREFHAEVAGRVTRPEASWNVMYEWIIRGGGELTLASLEHKMVAGSMFIDGTETSIYASGVYDRTQFDRPLGHYPMWLGIEHAQMRGMKRLELGAVPHQGTVSEKEYQIGYFKRGFATHTETYIEWRWLVGS